MENNFLKWRNKITRFITGQTISLFGSLLVQYAIIWYLTLETKSGLIMTISVLLGFLPQVVVSFFAGVWADRYNKKHLIMIADLSIAVSTLILAILFLFNLGSIWLIFVILVIRSIGSGVQMPAVSSFIPEIVPQDKLLKVNGINGTLQSLSLIICPVISGALLSITSLEKIFFIDVFTAIIGILLLVSIKTNKPKEKNKGASHIQELKEGFEYLKSHRVVKTLLKFYSAMCFMFVPLAFLTALLVTRKFGDSVWMLTANEVVWGLGSVVGGIIISAWGGFKNRIHTLIFSSIGFGLFAIVMGFSVNFTMYLVVMFIEGIFMPFFNITSTVFFQENVEKEMQGRIFGFLQIIMNLAMPVGMLVFGPLADKIQIDYMLIFSGIFLCIFGGMMYYNKTLNTQKR